MPLLHLYNFPRRSCLVPRRSLRDRIQADATPPQGREALYSPSLTPDQTNERRRTKNTPRWEDVHQRVTFHCPRTLLEALEAEVARSDRSKSRVIVEALTAYLQH